MTSERTNLVDEYRLPKFFGELRDRIGILRLVDKLNETIFPLYLFGSF